MTKNNELSCEYQYRFFLDKIKMKEGEMHSVQRQEVKRAFMAGCGQALLMMRDGIAALPEKEAESVFNNLLKEVSDFWQKENELHQLKIKKYN